MIERNITQGPVIQKKKKESKCFIKEGRYSYTLHMIQLIKTSTSNPKRFRIGLRDPNRTQHFS